MTDMANHPIVLHADLFAEDPRAPQTQFVLERQIAFLEALATTGSVRAAARRVKVSHQTCYRARRNSAAFGRAWDAALVVARGAAEAKLADYAMNGVEEEVWYHGDLVGHRKRFSDRLLLAHLARLDRMRSDMRIEALAEDFDGLLRRMRQGEAIDVEVEGVPAPDRGPGQAEAGTSGSCASRPEAPAFAGDRVGADRGGDNSSPGRCNTRSMSGEPDAAAQADPQAEPRCDCPGAVHGFDRGERHWRRGPQGWEPMPNVDGSGPCCEHPSWPECRACPHYPAVSRLLAMEEERPDDAPSYAELTGDPAEIEECQMAAFEAEDEDWWRYGEDWVLHTRDADGMWVAEEWHDEMDGADRPGAPWRGLAVPKSGE
ncbi:hypothetical protein [Qipengyuania sp.]|uniref:hypothetical protein n=1 Tax=Qipengyuania sp. TaxID=2004515 RepID=UPI003BA93E7D